ncbi:hypothetical protein AVEN_166409-1 [Araneus ventricosus]|uniref:Uncharacterized protein n=1 Tax=Araneus ventricosus TaxID=182803 RepID=A0A4Y2U336_ARAVE|nr:hypothetical protein AVEN_166409-1 [Araneus ventricosus]
MCELWLGTKYDPARASSSQVSASKFKAGVPVKCHPHYLIVLGKILRSDLNCSRVASKQDSSLINQNPRNPMYTNNQVQVQVQRNGSSSTGASNQQ